MSRPQSLFLPIHPELAIAILRGTKKWELRTRRPAVERGDVVVIYATSPLKAVVGSFTVGEVVSATPEKIWRLTHRELASTRSSFFERFEEASVLHAIEVKRPRRIDPYTPRFQVARGGSSSMRAGTQRTARS